jgi:hypothetical protein
MTPDSSTTQPIVAALAANLEGVADHEAVQARISADQDHRTPPSAAVSKARTSLRRQRP